MANRISLLCGLTICALLVGAPRAHADKVHLQDGRVLEGTVQDANADEVVIKLRFGNVTIARDEVVRIDYELTDEQKFEKALESATDADACMAAAKAGLADGIDKRLIHKAYERAVKLDPDHREAHEALGHVNVNGKWLGDEAAKRAMGWIEFEGELMAPDKVAAIRAKRDAERRTQATANRDSYLKELKGVPWGRAKSIETDHYIVRCNSSERVAKRYADFMEKVYSAYDQVFTGYKRYFTGKNKIYIFRSVKDFQEYGGGRPGVGGYYLPKSPNENLYPSRIISAYHGTFGTTGDTREVLAHEGTHQFEHILCAGPAEKFMVRPAWWVEGLAVYFGDGYKVDSKGNLSIGIPRDRLMVLQHYVKAGQFPPISRFVRLPYRQFSQMAGLSYPYGWSLCHYFLHRGSQGGGAEKAVSIGGKEVMLSKVFRKFFELVLAEPPPLASPGAYGEYFGKKLDEIFGFSVDQLTDDWKKYVLDMKLEKLGEITSDGERYVSKELSFEVAKPKDWVWKAEEAQGREAIRIENPSTSGLVIITAEGNMDNSSLEELKDNAERGAAQKLESIYIEDSKEIEVGGYKAILFTYEGKEVAAQGGSRAVKVRAGEQRYRHVVLSTVRRSYEIVMQCDKDKQKENQAAFDAVLKAFKVLAN